MGMFVPIEICGIQAMSDVLVARLEQPRARPLPDIDLRCVASQQISGRLLQLFRASYLVVFRAQKLLGDVIDRLVERVDRRVQRVVAGRFAEGCNETHRADMVQDATSMRWHALGDKIKFLGIYVSAASEELAE